VNTATIEHLDCERSLPKVATGIQGLDEITGGGLPQGRPTLVCGGAGSGKTLFGVEFLVRGATEYNEPGVLMSFEETEAELTKNFRSLGFDLERLVADQKLRLDYVRVERSEIEETGEYDLEGVFVRLGYAIDAIGAKRVVLDTIEGLFSAFTDDALVRGELRRLLRWLKDKGVTAIITGERGKEEGLTRWGIEEYVSDCVILLDQRVREQIATRRVRVVKYRGTTHETNEYPFVIDERGISVLPVLSLGLGLEHQASRERVSTGIERLDTMLGGRGIYRGSTAMVSGTAGTGKTSLAAHFVDAACRRGEKCLYFAFEESPSQIMRNMESIGICLEQHVQSGLLCFQASRPMLRGLEQHLSTIHQVINDFQPPIVVLDPVTKLTASDRQNEVNTMLLRLIDFLKGEGITTFLTTLTGAGRPMSQPETIISSLIDTWIVLREIESDRERSRGLYVVKSRGMAHSKQVREYHLTDHGFGVLDVYLGTAGGLTGVARLAQEAKERAEEGLREQEFQRKQTRMQADRKSLEAQIAALQAKLIVAEQEMEVDATEEELRRPQVETDTAAMAQSRPADAAKDHAGLSKQTQEG
jgi:circadian clock protein KaiC